MIVVQVAIIRYATQAFCQTFVSCEDLRDFLINFFYQIFVAMRLSMHRHCVGGPVDCLLDDYHRIANVADSVHMIDIVVSVGHLCHGNGVKIWVDERRLYIERDCV